MRRCSGIWPPSNPRRREYPRRAFCPLSPAPEVLPSFEPMPRPTRTLRGREPIGGRKGDRLVRLGATGADLPAGLRRIVVFVARFWRFSHFFVSLSCSPPPPQLAAYQ